MLRGRISYDQLMELGDNKYALTIAVARRARQLHDGADPLIEGDASKPVLLALQEFREGKLRYVSRMTGDRYEETHPTEDPA
ncbi:MAG: DNA-directed RNA polymerase subunit omega [Bacillota bacterium]